MFDVSFSELLLIGVIALIVIGPERLPKVARTVGHLLGRAQRYVNDVKTDIRREMDAEEFAHLKNQVEDAANTVRASVNDAGNSLRRPFDDAQRAMNDAKGSFDSLARPDAGTQTAAGNNPAPGEAAGQPQAAQEDDSASLPLPGFEPPPVPQQSGQEGDPDKTAKETST